MSIIKSLIFGSNGTYNVFGIPVEFIDLSNKNAGKEDKISKYAKHVIFQPHIHSFVHEMGHVLAHRVLLNKNPPPRVRIYNEGGTTSYSNKPPISSMHKSLITAAGPVVGMTFASCRLLAGLASSRYILSISLQRGLGDFAPSLVTLLGFYIPALYGMFTELLYAIHSIGDYEPNPNPKFVLVMRLVVISILVLTIYSP